MFDSLLVEHRDTDHRFTVYRSGDPPAIETWLADHGVDVDARPLPPAGPPPFIEIETDGEVVGVVGVEAAEGLLAPPVARPGDRTDVSEGYRVFFDTVAETVFSGMGRRDLLAVSREIEDRAFRVGDGTLWACFQTLSTFESQADVYRTLAAETALDIHVYGVGDWSPPEIAGVTYHTRAAERFQPYWALAYDGGGDRSQACGLVAEERSDEYTGFWTNDPAVVGEIAARLRAD